MSSTASGSSDARPRFAVTEDIGESDAVIRLAGELDHDAAPALRESLERCESAAATRILVDFSDLVFCDSTGLNALLEARARARARGAAVELVGLSRGVFRVFEVTGAGTLFPQYPTLAEAGSDGDR